VRWHMVVVVHRDNDPQESTDLGQNISPYVLCAPTI